MKKVTHKNIDVILRKLPEKWDDRLSEVGFFYMRGTGMVVADKKIGTVL